uniref:methylcrotonoyl-CoA carboxylase n=1 Tax=Oryzias sinensis TaxID=183150 RepID=A0A8C7X1T6_9TELE
MDDIKLHAKSEPDIDSLIHTTRIYSTDIGMSFGLEKCSRMVTKRGKVVHTGGVSLPEGTIADIEDSYKYLGILQANGNLEQATSKRPETGGGFFSFQHLQTRFTVVQYFMTLKVAVVCGSCTAGGAYIPTMAEEAVMVHQIGTIFLGGPPLVKAATGEEVTPEELGGARLHAEVSGCVDHFAWEEKEAFDYTKNIISTFNFQLPHEEEDSTRRKAAEEPLYGSEELMGLAPRSYNYSLDAKMVVSRLTDGSRFQEFKALYGTTLITGFAKIHGHLVGIVANNGVLSYEAALKGSHFIQLCDQRDVPLIFLQNTAPSGALTLSTKQAEMNSNCLKAQGSMMAAVACASVPKITVVIGGSHGADSYAMCGRAFEPNFLFLWPNARVSVTAPGHVGALLPPDAEEEEEEKLNRRLKEESSAFFSSGRMWDDGVILPQDTRKVKD